MHAQSVFFPDDTTLDSSNQVAGDAYLGYANLSDYLNEINGTSPTITMVDGGSVANNLRSFNGSVFDMLGGIIGGSYGSLLGFDSSISNMSGGLIDIDAKIQEYAVLNLSGGVIGNDVVTYDNSFFRMSGGEIDHDLLTNAYSQAWISGGDILADIFVQDESSLTMQGMGLTAIITDPNYEYFYTEYTLDGHLADGTDVTGHNVFVQNGSGATFAVASVPGPAAVLPFVTSLVAVIRRRRK